MSKIKVVPISEARSKLTALVEEVSRSPEPCFIASRSKVRAVLLGIEEYDSLLEQLEDLEDSIAVLEARLAKEPSRPFEEFVRELEAGREADVQRRA